MPAVGYGVGIIGGHFARLWNVGVNVSLFGIYMVARLQANCDKYHTSPYALAGVPLQIKVERNTFHQQIKVAMPETMGYPAMYGCGFAVVSCNT